MCLIPNKEKRAKKFERGLNYRIRIMMSYLDIQNFSQLVNQALIYEESLKENAVEYTDQKKRAQRPLEFEVGDHVFLKVSPIRGVMQFGKKRKLSPRYIGPFEITQRVGRLAYGIALPLNFVETHDVFNVSMLRKYIANPDVVMEYEPLEIQEGLTYIEEPVKIVDKKEQVLCTKTIPTIKVLWHNHGVEEASWEAEHDMRSRYPHLFE